MIGPGLRLGYELEAIERFLNLFFKIDLELLKY